MLRGSQSRSGRFGEAANFLPRWEQKTILRLSVRSLVTTVLQYTRYIYVN